MGEGLAAPLDGVVLGVTLPGPPPGVGPIREEPLVFVPEWESGPVKEVGNEYGWCG